MQTRLREATRLHIRLWRVYWDPMDGSCAGSSALAREACYAQDQVAAEHTLDGDSCTLVNKVLSVIILGCGAI